MSALRRRAKRAIDWVGLATVVAAVYAVVAAIAWGVVTVTVEVLR